MHIFVQQHTRNNNNNNNPLYCTNLSINPLPPTSTHTHPHPGLALWPTRQEMCAGQLAWTLDSGEWSRDQKGSPVQHRYIYADGTACELTCLCLFLAIPAAWDRQQHYLSSSTFIQCVANLPCAVSCCQIDADANADADAKGSCACLLGSSLFMFYQSADHALS